MTINKTKTKIMIGLVVSLLMFILPFTVLAHTGHSVGGTSTENELDEVNKEIAKLEQEVQISHSTKSTLKIQIQLIGIQVRLIELKIEILQKDITQLSDDILKTEEEVELLKSEIDHKKSIIREYIRLIYKDDARPLLEVFVATDKFSDFLVSQSSLVTVQESIYGTFKELKELEQKLDEKLLNLAEKRQSLLDKQSELLAKRQSLEKEKQGRRKLLKQTRGKESQYKKELAARRKKQAELFKLIVEEGGRDSNYVSAGKIPIFDFPVARSFVTQGYGYTDWAKGGAYNGGIHNGIDLASTAGDPIYAPADGAVYKKGKENCGSGCRSAYGNWIVLKHTFDSEDGKSTIAYYTLYAHMQTHSAALGDVRAGDIIGYMGSTGASTGSHLHFTVYRVICSKADDVCDDSMPTTKTGPGWYAKNSVDPFDFMKTAPDGIRCSSHTDWDRAYKHVDQCHSA